MKLLIINGTPKTEGITHSFVLAAAETAAKLGIDCEVIRLAGEKLQKCKMCGNGWGVCFSEHYCAFGEEDGFAALQSKVKEAGGFVYITPVYWGEVSEEMKIFTDKLRRCEASKKWDRRENVTSFHQGKPSIIVANAGGGGGGIVTCFAALERAISHMDGDEQLRQTSGIFDFIAVNRWNQNYKRETLRAAITEMCKYITGEIPAAGYEEKVKQ